MEVTKTQVLESMNTYCTERKYGSDSLTDGFKEKFADNFVKKYEGKDVDENVVTEDLHFTLDTAFNASRGIISSVSQQFTTKENDYKKQIEELKKKIPAKHDETHEIPKEVQDQLDELKAFKDEKSRQEKLTNIMALAKQGIRQDLHKSFDNYAKDYVVKLDKEDKEQADALVSRFADIFKDTIGEIKPLAPVQTQKRDEELINSIPKVKI